MITESYPELTKVIGACPELFSKSEIIGVFTGDEICASILYNASKLERIRFYENLSFTDSEEIKNDFINMYKDWESTTPNLEVLITDGRNFDMDSTFIYHDMDMANVDFFQLYKSKLRGKLLANCGFGSLFRTTYDFILLTHYKNILPIMLYRDILFYVFDKNSYYNFKEIIQNNLTINNIKFEIQPLDVDQDIIKIVVSNS